MEIAFSDFYINKNTSHLQMELHDTHNTKTNYYDSDYYNNPISNKDQLNLAMRVLQNIDIVSTVKRVV